MNFLMGVPYTKWILIELDNSSGMQQQKHIFVQNNQPILSLKTFDRYRNTNVLYIRPWHKKKKIKKILFSTIHVFTL